VPINDLASVGKRIRHAREDLRKLTQKQLAAAAGIKQPSLSELETGETKEITGAVLIAIAKALRVRPEWLMTAELPVEAGTNRDEQDLLDRYRQASDRLKTAIRYVAGMLDGVPEQVATEHTVHQERAHYRDGVDMRTAKRKIGRSGKKIVR
jgi:transcriptional regulator with XRE-family HTH domain